MLKFYFVRASRDLFGHLILIVLPVILIGFFNYIYRDSGIISGIEGNPNPFITVLTIGFALTFQIYGGALSYETIGVDFYSPMRGRLQASPKEPRSLILSIVSTSIVVSFLQTLLVLMFSVFVLDAAIPSLPVVLLIMIVSIIVNQLLGTVILLKTGKVKTATTIMNVYGILSPMLAGLFFPLPNTAFFDVVKKYLTPMALANTAIFGVMENDLSMVVAGVVPLILISMLLYMAIRPLSRKVAE